MHETINEWNRRNAVGADPLDNPMVRLRAELIRRDRQRAVLQAIALLSLAFAVGFFGTAWWAL